MCQTNCPKMYEYERKTSLVTIASAIPHNLALFDVGKYELADSMAVIHGSFINFIPIVNKRRRARYVCITDGERKGQETITQLKWVKIHNEPIFVALSTIGLQIYDIQVNDVIFFHCCKESGDRLSYTQGVCVLNDILCIGTSLGSIWLFKANENNTNFEVIGRYYGHDEAIRLLDQGNEALISCSERVTYLWRYINKELEIFRKIELSGMDVEPTALKVSDSLIFLGCSSGEFCIYDISNEDYCLKTVAHCCKIVDLDFSPLKYLVLSASVDAYVKIWSLDCEQRLINCEFSLFNDLGPICGAGFMNLCGSVFCVVTVDEVDVKFYRSKEEKEQRRINYRTLEVEKFANDKPEIQHMKSTSTPDINQDVGPIAEGLFDKIWREATLKVVKLSERSYSRRNQSTENISDKIENTLETIKEYEQERGDDNVGVLKLDEFLE